MAELSEYVGRRVRGQVVEWGQGFWTAEGRVTGVGEPDQFGSELVVELTEVSGLGLSWTGKVSELGAEGEHEVGGTPLVGMTSDGSEYELQLDVLS